jgi:hypothetical protein
MALKLSILSNRWYQLDEVHPHGDLITCARIYYLILGQLFTVLAHRALLEVKALGDVVLGNPLFLEDREEDHHLLVTKLSDGGPDEIHGPDHFLEHFFVAHVDSPFKFISKRPFNMPAVIPDFLSHVNKNFNFFGRFFNLSELMALVYPNYQVL